MELSLNGHPQIISHYFMRMPAYTTPLLIINTSLKSAILILGARVVDFAENDVARVDADNCLE